jgi:hypothetical protein
MPIAAAAGLALYQESESAVFYGAFVIGSAVCGGYFLFANFWFLDIVIGGLHLRIILQLIGNACMAALLLPGLVRGAVQVRSMSLLLPAHAVMLAFLEEHLYVGYGHHAVSLSLFHCSLARISQQL